MDIQRNVTLFVDGIGKKNKGRKISERYASFDYCFNYFQTFREQNRIAQLAEPRHIQVSSLQLGFYLASWGMLRGSSFLLEKSVRFYEPLIRGISTFDKRIWKIDVDTYNEANIDLLLSCREMIVEALGRQHRPSDTLVTKIMLGVFANVPAFDDFVRIGFGIRSIREKSLRLIAEFYEENKAAIDRVKIYTFDCASNHTRRNEDIQRQK